MNFLSKIFGKKVKDNVSANAETVFLMVGCENKIVLQELDFILSHYDGVEASRVMVLSRRNPFSRFYDKNHVEKNPSANHWVVKCLVELKDKVSLAINEFKVSKAKLAIHKRNKPAVMAA